MLDQMRAEAAGRGDRLAALSVEHLGEIKDGFDRSGIDTSPYYRFEPPADLGFATRSVLVVASPAPHMTASFMLGEAALDALIPPSYAGAEDQEQAVHACLAASLGKAGYHIATAEGLPCKPLAANAGLGQLGRNNLLYVDGMGSFLRLTLFYTDLPCDRGVFHALRVMDSCEGCSRCVDSCPTGALAHGRTLVAGERCLTTHNEHAGDFPQWIDPRWHHALVGCVRCQYACPQNARNIGTPRNIARYDRAQTQALLTGQLPPEALLPLRLPQYYHGVLARNLRALAVALTPGYGQSPGGTT